MQLNVTWFTKEINYSLYWIGMLMNEMDEKIIHSCAILISPPLGNLGVRGD